MKMEMPKKRRVLMPWMRKRGRRLLWEREFKVVKRGLDEEQVVSFVNELMAQYSASLYPLLETTVTDAEQAAASIKMKAQAEAEAEVATVISQAKQEAQEIKRRAEIETQKGAEDILSVANRKAEITEVEAKQRALLFLFRAREEIEEEIKEECKRAYSRLFSSLQDLMSEGQNIGVELKGKRARLLESKNFGLREYEATLLSSSGATAPPLETLAPTESEIEPAMATEEKIEQPTQLQEETVEEKVEQPVQPREEVTEKKLLKRRGKIEQPTQLQEETVEEKVEQPTQPQEEATEKKLLKRREKIEQPTQLQEETVEEKVEQPTQLQEEAVVSEPVEAITEELLEQHPPEERPVTEETKSTPLKLESQDLYAGEIELIIASPVELELVSRLYNYLQTVSELRILYTKGSWDRGTTITVVLDKPLPLISIISKTPGVEVTPELFEKEGLATGKSGSPLRAGGKGVKGIKLILKEAQPH